MSGTLFDIERVEVVKAAQGTLFGEGSQGGTIRYLYKQPDTTGFDAAVNLSYSDMGASEDNSRRLDGMVNIPFGDGFGLRLTGWETETAGYVDELGASGELVAAVANPAARSGARVALRRGSRFRLGELPVHDILHGSANPLGCRRGIHGR